MILGIDATNISSGGGLNHLKKLLENAEPGIVGFEKVIIWGSERTLGQLVDPVWLEKCSSRLLNKNLLCRSLWKLIYMGPELKKSNCNILFAPGGSYLGKFHPYVTMSRNMLPFDWKEMRRFGLSYLFFKMLALRLVQTRTYKFTDGIIFLTNYAQTSVLCTIGRTKARTAIIPHGINSEFFSNRKLVSRSLNSSENTNFHLLYVSIIDMYKHQWNVLRAVSELRKLGYNLTVEFVGPSNPKALRKFNQVLEELDPKSEYCFYTGNVKNEKLPKLYAKADICVFASTCENMPNILLEAMASGLPIACSSKQPMPEILGDAGVYFHPEKVYEIKSAIKKLLDSSHLRDEMSAQSAFLAKQYSWKKTASDTFRFLFEIASKCNSPEPN